MERRVANRYYLFISSSLQLNAVANYLTQDLTFYENDSCQGQTWPELALIGVSEGRSIRLKVPRREPLYEELRSFCDAVRYGTEPVVSGEAGVAALEIAGQMIEAGLRDQPAAKLIERALAVGM